MQKPIDGVIHQQGSLDCLCGIYCVINAILLQTKQIEGPELFEFIIKNIGNRLPHIILQGIIGLYLERKIFNSCKKFLKTKNITFSHKQVEADTLDEYWDILQNHFNTHGEGSIILSIAGKYDHWTCVRKITKKRIILADSSHLKYLNRTKLTIDSATKRRTHSLLPEETYLLSIESA